MAEPPDSLRAYIEHHRGGYRRFNPPYTVQSFANMLDGWYYHRQYVAAPDRDEEADIFFRRFTDYVQMKTGVYASRYWGLIIDGEAGAPVRTLEPPPPRTKDELLGSLERAHALFFTLYDSFWADRAAGRPLRGTPPPDDRY